MIKLAAVVLLGVALGGCLVSSERSSGGPADEVSEPPRLERKADSRRGDEQDGRARSGRGPSRPAGGGVSPSLEADPEPTREEARPLPAAASGSDRPTGEAGPAVAAGVALDCYQASAEICGIEREIFRLVNELRAREGKPPFKYSRNLGFISRDWSAAQASAGPISHDGFPGERNRKYEKEFPGSRVRIRAENVAMGGGGDAAGTGARMFQMWADSPGHRRNLLGSFGALGIGIASGSRGWYGTQIFGETDE